ncbi:zinc finger protein 501-like isoform X2 [Drosophila innubila]|uniref:zinc finger protein 501-like isoform X2 n=1 Tax=Drosophila innubila TaxID=198719 RepID=UPI00148CAB66|nr:zinc finger protein 501-like isoform X2 [Drosophila innubila]
MDISCVKVEPEQEDETLWESDLGVNHIMLETENTSEIDIGPIKIEPENFTECQALGPIRSIISPTKKKHPTAVATAVRFSYQCDHCPRHFERSDELEIHTQIHSNNLLYKCSYCPNSFSHKSIFTAHMYVHGKFPYECPECPKGFLKNSDLKKHARLHVDKRLSKCPLCPRNCTHNGNNPIQCPQCPRSFMKSDELEIHLQIHSDKLPYKCPYCPSSFAHKSNYLSHICEHTGEFPYKCHECPQGFMRRIDLMRHLQISHCDQQLINSRQLLKRCTKSLQSEIKNNLNKNEKIKTNSQSTSIKAKAITDKESNKLRSQLLNMKEEIIDNKQDKEQKQEKIKSSLHSPAIKPKSQKDSEHIQIVKDILDVSSNKVTNDKKQSIDTIQAVPSISWMWKYYRLMLILRKMLKPNQRIRL